MIKQILDKLLDNIDLSFEEATKVADLLMNGEINNSQIAALLTALKMKGETPNEIAGFATAMSLPVWIAYLVAGAELLGGAGIMVGFFTRLSALVELLLWLVRLYWHIFLRVFQV